MRTTEMVLIALFLMTSKFLPASVSIYILSMSLDDIKDLQLSKRIEYIREEFTRKKCKTAILLYCFHTAGVLHIFMITFWALEHIFLEKRVLNNYFIFLNPFSLTTFHAHGAGEGKRP